MMLKRSVKHPAEAGKRAIKARFKGAGKIKCVTHMKFWAFQEMPQRKK